MAKHTATLDDNETVKIVNVNKPDGMDFYQATICVYGADFGGGTVKIQLSPDGGTTKIDLKDSAGTVVEITDNDVVNIDLGNVGKNSDTLGIWANLAGATNPDPITVDLFDNYN